MSMSTSEMFCQEIKKNHSPSPFEPFQIQRFLVFYCQDSCFPLREHVVCINEISSRDVIRNVLLMCKKVLNNLFGSIVANFDFFLTKHVLSKTFRTIFTINKSSIGL